MTRAQKIQAAFERHGTDKASHGYAEFYAAHLPENPRSILEIGVKDGASFKAWRDLFPDAFIVGIDLFQEYPRPDHLQDSNTKFIKANQCDWRHLEQLRDNNFDVIIDDGSHNARDQMITFFGLAHAGCHYFIEDTHCNFDEFYSQGLPWAMRAAMLFDEDAFSGNSHEVYVLGEPSSSKINFIKC